MQFIKACELKGHSDWIRSLDFSLPVTISSEKHNLFLVSSSQDRTIRIWKMDSEAVSSGSTAQLRKANIEMTSYIEGPLFVAGNTSYQVSLESLLVGHEDWVYSVEWQPPTVLPGNEAHQAMSMLALPHHTHSLLQVEKKKGRGRRSSGRAHTVVELLEPLSCSYSLLYTQPSQGESFTRYGLTVLCSF